MPPAETPGTRQGLDPVTMSPFKECIMPKYLIEREIPGAGDLLAEDLQGIAQTSCGVLRSMGPQIQWIQSYVTDDKITCVYIAPDEATIRQHAEQGGFPANKVSRIGSVIDPTTAE
jgi:Nickel responsive protein SCO4226-like